LELGGGVTARLIFLGAGHTAGGEVILVGPDRVLITGDTVQNKVVPSVASSGGSFASRHAGGCAQASRCSCRKGRNRLTEVFKTSYPDWAANPDWPNVNYSAGFVNRLYVEIRD